MTTTPITRHEYFATAAMRELIRANADRETCPVWLSDTAYKFADEMEELATKRDKARELDNLNG